VPRTPLDTTSTLTAGRYHNDWTGIEFSVPGEIHICLRLKPVRTREECRGIYRHRCQFTRIAVWMNNRKLRPENIPENLTSQIPLKIQRRGGPAAGYTIPENGIRKLQIGGEQAIRATAWYSDRGMKMVELLAWISTEHDIAHFYAIMPADTNGYTTTRLRSDGDERSGSLM